MSGDRPVGRGPGQGPSSGPGGYGGRARLVSVAVGCAALLTLATACGGSGSDGGSGGDRHKPVSLAGKGAALRPVPQGKGSRVDDDFNGDGARDLVLDDLAHPDGGDDAGIGVLYGGPDGLTPGARQLLTAHANGARTKGQLPAAFESEASCDLNKDGFTDLVVSTDPPYDGQGQPPVPLQILFGSPRGLAGKAVKLQVPAQARFGNDWADQPACGDFDGDGASDLVVHASGARLSFLRGPFTRKGAPRAAGKPLLSPGNDILPLPATDVDRDGYDDIVVRKAGGTLSVVRGGPKGPNRTGVLLPSGTDVAFGRFGKGKGTDAAVAGPRGVALRYDVPGTVRGTLESRDVAVDAGDFDGDGLSELVLSGAGSGDGGAAGDVRVLRARASGLVDNATALVGSGSAKGTTRVLKVADFDGDKKADLVLQTSLDSGGDTVGVHPGAESGTLVSRKARLTFSTAEFTTMEKGASS
ncbi:FG-GAP repeat domain-containing protein [Streptomyces sp. NPDC059009]|uniref:FG-GAP repeat domain-containing protein n=1 Tax=Streptomyces sp. NPDC059009 TaxID=3346694 RepID=UPI0036CE5DE2